MPRHELAYEIRQHARLRRDGGTAPGEMPEPVADGKSRSDPADDRTGPRLDRSEVAARPAATWRHVGGEPRGRMEMRHPEVDPLRGSVRVRDEPACVPARDL